MTAAARKTTYRTGFCGKGGNHAMCPVVVDGTGCGCEYHDPQQPLASVHTLHASSGDAGVDTVPVPATPSTAQAHEAAVVAGTGTLDLRTRASLVAFAKVLGEAIKDGEAQARAGVFADLLAMYDDTGAKSIVVRLPGTDTKVATITLNEPADKPVVDDPAALLAWVKANRPGEVIVVESVRESYMKWLLEKGITLDTVTGECLLVDTDTGETTVVPGMRAKAAGRPTSFGLRFEPSGRDAVREAAVGTSGAASLAQLVTGTVVEARP